MYHWFHWKSPLNSVHSQNGTNLHQPICLWSLPPFEMHSRAGCKTQSPAQCKSLSVAAAALCTPITAALEPASPTNVGDTYIITFLTPRPFIVKDNNQRSPKCFSTFLNFCKYITHSYIKMCILIWLNKININNWKLNFNNFYLIRYFRAWHVYWFQFQLFIFIK